MGCIPHHHSAPEPKTLKPAGASLWGPLGRTAYSGGRSCRLPAGECLGLAVPPNTHLHQPVVSRACPRASEHARPRLPWGVLPGRGRLWEGGLGGRGGKGQGTTPPPIPRKVRSPGWRPGPPQLTVWAGTNCGTFRASGTSSAQSKWGPTAPSTNHGTLGILVPARGGVEEGCGHQRAPELHPAGSRGITPPGGATLPAGTLQHLCQQGQKRARGRGKCS